MNLHPKHEIANAVARCADHLRVAAQRYPKAWRQIDTFRARREEFGDWPPWCFCPLSGAYAIVCDQHELADLTQFRHADAYSTDDEEAASVPTCDVGRIGGLGAWRVSQGVHWIDETIRQAVLETPAGGEVPVDVLLSLPEWCLYIPLPGHTIDRVGLQIARGEPGAPVVTSEVRTKDCPVSGFFAWLESDTNDRRTELRILIDWAERQPFISLESEIIHLHRGLTLDQCYERMLTEMERQAALQGVASTDYQAASKLLRSNARERLSPLLSILLYLCSKTAEYRAGGETKPSKPKYAEPSKTKSGWRLFAPERAKVWYVGERLGDAIRQAYEVEDQAEAIPGHHARPRPHVRRAHWHTYWLGSKDIASPLRRPELRWLPPIPVALAEDTPEARMRAEKLKPIKDLKTAVDQTAAELQSRGPTDG